MVVAGMASSSSNETVAKGNMWDLDQKLDQNMDEEAGRIQGMYREKKSSSMAIMLLAFQSLGVVFGDLGTSPLYVFYNTFPHGIRHQDDVIGALSLIIYSLTLIALLKYVAIVLRANDNGQGKRCLYSSGTFALYSLLCRHANIKTIANQHRSDEELTTYSRGTFEEHTVAGNVKCWLESHSINKNAILFLVLIGTCLMIGDGILTPAISAYIMQNPEHVADAFYRSIPGTTVVIDMIVTTLLMILIMLMVWRSNLILVIVFAGLTLSVELTYFSSVILKVDQGGWVPLVVAATVLLIMYVWHYGTIKRYEFEMHSKVSMAWILGLGPSLGLVRVPGLGFVYTELASGVPHIFSHLITNLPAIHSVVVFVCIKFLPVYTVPLEERVLVRRIGPKDFHMFRCVARYGYQDLHRRDDDFEKMLFDSISAFVRLESLMDYSDSVDLSLDLGEDQSTTTSIDLHLTDGTESIEQHKFNTTSISEEDELEFLNRCRDAGVVHILGNTITRARRDSGFLKKIAIDYIHSFLRKICTENSVMLNIPHESMLNVGQIFYV
ncbi:Putative potassium transporter 12 [Apostasia shenzhenica]|uniref:Potassium transporter 12 n=1 Tax=Apostasia shenzhenica TaxID=1088818 RepID=A0A2H9ZTP8_9ASPA|nr:Putative potassium transporter 12 [Apostasia shenzhenica]